MFCFLIQNLLFTKVKFKTGIELRKKIIEEIIKNKEIEKVFMNIQHQRRKC